MSLRLLVAALVLLVSTPSSAEPRNPIPRNARDVATQIVKSELSANSEESLDKRRLRIELVQAQKLLHQALRDATTGEDTGAAARLGAECGRLQPRVAAAASETPRARFKDWRHIDRALSELCEARADVTATADPTRKRSKANALLQRVERSPDPSLQRVGPTMRFPKASELTPRYP